MQFRRRLKNRSIGWQRNNVPRNFIASTSHTGTFTPPSSTPTPDPTLTPMEIAQQSLELVPNWRFVQQLQPDGTHMLALEYTPPDDGSSAVLDSRKQVHVFQGPVRVALA